ncbi:emp24/gp25L/p24 family protein [Nitzschia inconspicua]|uniref:Emp24/gp25L/p24 family protein n=1 Tax=Nitzschia inconspicua TaxID=303405 RepID=A0A9K3KJE8_9STRA|nr:emp24/gp25L/p24 family protein [Nitzschia inconspicua]
MTVTTRIRYGWVAVVTSLLLAVMLFDCTSALPYMILTSTRSKCMSVVAPQGQTIKIDYYAPDLKIPEDSDEGEESLKKEEKPPATDGQDGLDNQWNKRMKERLEKMKSKKMRDMSITVTQKSDVSGVLTSNQQRKTSTSNDSKTAGSGRVREELEKKEGSVYFMTGDEDGTVEICVQSILASINNPARFTMKVTWSASEQDDREGRGRSGSGSLDKNELQSKMTRLERDIQTLENRVKACLNNADFNKDQEAAFHQQSVAMNKAATYWPIIHLIVLLLTGFTQANHIVHYFKTHHIGV